MRRCQKVNISKSALLYMELVALERCSFVVNLHKSSEKGELRNMKTSTRRSITFSFWGIFFVDASSDMTAKQSFARIATIGGAEPNERAAKHWLSNLDHPWLLIVDSADDPNIPLEKYFPEGDRGCILITTRNPDFRVHGTVGERALEFRPMEHEEAEDLLLKAASMPSPWDTLTRTAARRISSALGFLPLALIHAGKAIISRLCTLDNYLEFFHRSWERIRIHRNTRKLSDHDAYLSVYSSYEIIYQGLEAKNTEASLQAIQLLKVFSFFHYENIRVDILRRAVTTPLREQEAASKNTQDVSKAGVMPKEKTWSQKLTDALYIARACYQRYTDTTGRVIPDVLLDAEEYDLKIAEALRELNQLSLITYNQTKDSYTMHELVHAWARQRPDMTTSDQGIWCQTALNVIARSISLLPEDSAEEDAIYRRELLPHVEHVLAHRAAISNRYKTFRMKRRRIIPEAMTARFTPTEASCLARCSRVYADNGRWEAAEELQVKVKDYVCWMLGMTHETSCKSMLFLSATYRQLGRGKDAAELQAVVVKCSTQRLGDGHPDIFRAMDHLGNTYWMIARVNQALELHQKAFDGMSKVLGPNHPDTLIIMGHLGRDLTRNFQFSKAKSFHKKSVEGLKLTLGAEHLDTLTAMSDLALSTLDMWERDPTESLDEAHTLMTEVVEKRRNILGRENYFTLWANANLARVKSAMAIYSESTVLFEKSLVIAKRNLGEDHIGTLFGRMHYCEDLTRQKRFAEAERELLDVLQRHDRMCLARHGQHPYRILTMLVLADCYAAQKTFNNALSWCEKALEDLRSTGGQGQPFEAMILEKLGSLRPNVGISLAQPNRCNISASTLGGDRVFGVPWGGIRRDLPSSVGS